MGRGLVLGVLWDEGPGLEVPVPGKARDGTARHGMARHGGPGATKAVGRQAGHGACCRMD